MRAHFAALLPIAAAAGLVIAGADAKALTIRYSFSNPSSSFTGGTIEVASLNQAVGTGPVKFTLTNGTETIAINAPFSSANSTELTYVGAIGSENEWSLQNFNFGQAFSPATPWGALLGTGTFAGTSGLPGSFD